MPSLLVKDTFIHSKFTVWPEATFSPAQENSPGYSFGWNRANCPFAIPVFFFCAGQSVENQERNHAQYITHSPVTTTVIWPVPEDLKTFGILVSLKKNLSFIPCMSCFSPPNEMLTFAYFLNIEHYNNFFPTTPCSLPFPCHLKYHCLLQKKIHFSTAKAV